MQKLLRGLSAAFLVALLPTIAGADYLSRPPLWQLKSDPVTLTAGAYTSVANDLGKMMQVTTGASTATITLMSASAAGDGKIEVVRKIDNGAGKTVVSNGSDLAWLQTQWDYVVLRSDGSAWHVMDYTIAPVMTVFTSSGTWSIPPLLKEVDVQAFAAGNGGGSGRRGAAGSARAGGVGAAGCTIVKKRLLGIDVTGSTVTITVGTGGAGGAAQTVDLTDGNAGSSGGATSFGSFLSAVNAGSTTAAGAGGTSANVTGPANTPARGNYSVPGSGGSSSITTTGGVGGAGPSGGGGAGGGITTGNAAQSGGTGGAGSTFASQANGGAGGAAGSTGTVGTSISLSHVQDGGGGGGGGGADTGSGGQAGANGGDPCGGGGGGGAGINGANSGAGGNGGRGELRATAIF